MTRPHPGVSIKRNVCFGVPCVAGTRVPTSGVRSFFLDGLPIVDVAREFHLTEEQVEAALRYELCRVRS